MCGKKKGISRKAMLYANFSIFLPLFFQSKKIRDSKEFYELINGKAKVAYLSFSFIFILYFLLSSFSVWRYDEEEREKKDGIKLFAQKKETREEEEKR